MRIDGRKPGQLRPLKITPNFLHSPQGSALIEFGKTRLVCSACIVDDIPSWMKIQKVQGGWITSEYQMLPASTTERLRRETSHGPGGRTHEIQRLIGRSLRAAVDLQKMGQRTIYIDCDVLDADGGTRCAGINGGMVALRLAVQNLMNKGALKENPLLCNIAAVSVGVLNSEVLLDLAYNEDSKAEVDMNLVMSDTNKIIEIQATSERKPFSEADLRKMIRTASKGIKKILAAQNKIFA